MQDISRIIEAKALEYNLKKTDLNLEKEIIAVQDSLKNGSWIGFSNVKEKT